MQMIQVNDGDEAQPDDVQVRHDGVGARHGESLARCCGAMAASRHFRKIVCTCTGILAYLAVAAMIIVWHFKPATPLDQTTGDFEVEMLTGTCENDDVDGNNTYVCYNVYRQVVFFQRRFHHCVVFLNNTVYDTGSEATSQLRAVLDATESPAYTADIVVNRRECTLFDESDYVAQEATAVPWNLALILIGVSIFCFLMCTMMVGMTI